MVKGEKGVLWEVTDWGGVASQRAQTAETTPRRIVQVIIAQTVRPLLPLYTDVLMLGSATK
jgi:hypothetical protein